MNKAVSDSEQFITRTGNYSDRISRRGYLPEIIPVACTKCSHCGAPDSRAAQRELKHHFNGALTPQQELDYWTNRAVHFEREYNLEKKKRQKYQQVVKCPSTPTPHN